MTNIQIFNNPDFGEVRTLEENGAVLFCGSDVAKALGYSNPSKALSDHCKGVTKRYTPTNGGMQELTFIPEPDLYRLVFGSKLPTAERFTDWVTSEVLPSIRRHGIYATAPTVEAMLSDPDTIIQLATTLKEERAARKALEAQAAADKPKVLFADAVSAAKTSILVGELAKLLKQNGIDIGQNRLFAWLRENGYLIRRNGTDYNMPTQRAMEQGLFEIKETVIAHADGHTSVNKTPKVTGKGQQYFVELFLDAEISKEKAVSHPREMIAECDEAERLCGKAYADCLRLLYGVKTAE